jgi:hypothetical protein
LRKIQAPKKRLISSHGIVGQYSNAIRARL